MPYKTRLRELKLKLQAEKGETISWHSIANEVGIAYSTIQRYASEAIPRPDYAVVDRLAMFFDVPIREFIYRVEDDDQGQQVAVALAG